MEWVRGSTRVDDKERRILLNRFYCRVKCQILKYQSGSIGLFPLHTNADDKQKACESHVRENIYCAMAIWALGQAYRHMDDNQGRYYELKQSAVKCMRGLLFCFMRQSKKLELFKKNQRSENSLHVIFNVNNGDAMYQADTEYPHLQIDAVSLYLLTMAQMIASGLQIIYTSDEVNFVQNLVYYIERAYRTPDYGMWERGTKENTGHKELNAVSIGMAKAALETLNGFNLYGNSGTSSSVIYVDPDAHNRNSTILHSLLPVASSSKVTDASLLTITGFPAFAIDDNDLRDRTQAEVLKNLEGKYGLKRFIKDGYKCVLEDRNRMYYEKRELELFHGVECEWPIFFVYLAMDALFKRDKEMAMHYMKMLQDNLLLNKDSGDILPKYYYVPKFYIEAERSKPHSQVRLPCDDNDIFLWGQALLIMTEILAEGLLDVNEIDPIGRHKKRYGFTNDRYSTFAIAETDLIVQVALISESRNLQTILSTFGIETQTPQQIEPIQIWPPSQLILAYERLGVNRKLNLLGRPSRPIGALGTSKIYRILGKTVVTYPKLLDEQDFYMSWDMFLVIDQIKTVISFVRSNWSMRGRPTVCFLLRENNLRGKHFHEMLELLASFKNGECGDTKVRLGKLQTLISTGCVEHLDFVQPDDKLKTRPVEDTFEELEENRVKDVDAVDTRFAASPSPSVKDRRFSRFSRQLTLQDEADYGVESEDDSNAKDIVTKSREALVTELREPQSLNRQMLILQELLKREGRDYRTQDKTVYEHIDEVYRKAGYDRNWSVVRRGAGLLRQLVDSLAPGITTLLVSGKVVTIGVYGHEEKFIYEPMTPASIQNVLYTYCYPHDVRESVLQQEMVLYLASYMATMPEAFEGMLKIRIGWIIQAMKQLLSYGNNLGSLYAQPPSAVKKLLKIVLRSRGKLNGHDVTPRTPLQKRQLDGAVHRTPLEFYDKVWNVLCNSPGGIMVCQHHLQQLPTISDMTQNEINFQLKVEELLNGISNPEHRQLIVELIVVLATILQRNPEVKFEGCVDLDAILQDAINIFCVEQEKHDKPATRESFYNTPSEGKGGTTAYLTRALVNRLLGEGLDHTACSIC